MSSREESRFPHVSPFDTIRHTDDEHGEYWSAREFYKILGYTEWRNFNNTVIKKAMRACEENGRAISEHFVQSYKAITGGKGAKQEVKDVLLSRYAAYLVVMILSGKRIFIKAHRFITSAFTKLNVYLAISVILICAPSTHLILQVKPQLPP